MRILRVKNTFFLILGWRIFLLSLSMLVQMHPKLLLNQGLNPFAGTNTHIFLHEHSPYHQAPLAWTSFSLIPSFSTVSFVKTWSLRLSIARPYSIGGVIPFSHLSTIASEIFPILLDIARAERPWACNSNALSLTAWESRLPRHF